MRYFLRVYFLHALFSSEGCRARIRPAYDATSHYGLDLAAAAPPILLFFFFNEAEKARRAARRRADRCRFTESHPTTRDRMSPARRRRGLLGTQEGSEPSLDLEATGGVFRAAAMAASTAVRKSHFDHLDHAGRLRLEREAYRIRVHQHLQRELRKHSIEFSYDREEGPEWGR